MEEEDHGKESKMTVDHGEAMMTLHKQEGDYEEDVTLFFPRLLMSSKRTAAAIEKEQKVCKLELYLIRTHHVSYGHVVFKIFQFSCALNGGSYISVVSDVRVSTQHALRSAITTARILLWYWNLQ